MHWIYLKHEFHNLFNYWNNRTFPRHSNLLRCTSIIIFILLAPQSEQTKHNRCCHCFRRWMSADDFFRCAWRNLFGKCVSIVVYAHFFYRIKSLSYSNKFFMRIIRIDVHLGVSIQSFFFMRYSKMCIKIGGWKHRYCYKYNKKCFWSSKSGY